MAASDLAAELGKEGFVFESSAMEPRVADAVLKLLDDGSSDISSLALKWYGRDHVVLECAELVHEGFDSGASHEIALTKRYSMHRHCSFNRRLTH